MNKGLFYYIAIWSVAPKIQSMLGVYRDVMTGQNAEQSKVLEQ